ncbi:fimbrin [Aureobasidium sp. EXF-12298]|nr:fimbrin [Aureobasidium sp. EXF-12298]
MNVIKLQRKYPQFDQNEIFQLSNAFQNMDVDDKGYIDEATVIKATQNSERQPYDVVRQALKEVELDSSRRVELDDYVDLISKLRTPSQAQKSMATGPTRSRGLSNAQLQGQQASPGHASKGSLGGGQSTGGGRIHVGGATSSSQHTINEDEREEFTRHINAVLAGDADIGNKLPFPTDTFEMFDECKDGLVLAKLINDSVPDTIDERVLNRVGKKIKTLNAFHMTENNNIVIESAKGIGCSVVNIGSGDIIEVKEHLILGLIWQIIRRGLLGKIDIRLHPELYRLLEDDETLEQFLRLPAEQILLRWFNYHLKNAKWHRTVSNFSSDVKDGENYTVLLNQLKPEICSRSPLQTNDLMQRAEQVLDNADKLDCRKFLTPKSLVAGNPKLNLAFVANLFNTHPGLEPITEEEKADIEDFDAEGEREARVFTLWLNSLDVQPTVVSFFDDLRDGTILLQAYDKVIPGSVQWRHCNKRPANGNELMRFKAVENTNYAVEIGKQNRFSLVGIQGADITDGQRTLTLGMVWQLMRKDIVNTLGALAQRMGKREISDSDMVTWANGMSKKGGKSSAIRSFKDSSLGNGIFLLDVLNGMKSSYVDYDMVASGRNDDEAYANAKLAISIARKMGATIWLVPEDICNVRSRLIVTFIGSLMATAEKMGV